MIFATTVVYCYKSVLIYILVESRHPEDYAKGVFSKKELIEIFVQALGKMQVHRCPALIQNGT